MDVHIKASREGVHRVLRETNRKRPTCMKEAGKQQNAKRPKKMVLFYIILIFALILFAVFVVLRMIMPFAVAVWYVFLSLSNIIL